MKFLVYAAAVLGMSLEVVAAGFKSASIEAKIGDMKARLGDTKRSEMFAKAFANTLETTVDYRVNAEGEDDTFVITGDIPAMWLRDSSAQVWPYLEFVKEDEALRRMIRGVLLRQFASIRLDPYANAFLREGEKSPWTSDLTEMKAGVHERKYELDSLCYPLRLAYGYWQASGDVSIFDARWLKTVEVILGVMREQQRKTGACGAYKFQRVTHVPGDTLTNYGWGWRAKPCGLIASAFRPSDDATVYPFHIPSNFMAVDVLRKTAEIVRTVNLDRTLAASCDALANEVSVALKREAVREHPKYGKIYAYEVDGFGNALFMDDANVPSLLSLPYIAGVRTDDPIYENTRQFVWSEDNVCFYRGKAGEGIGSPHTGLDRIWPMSQLMRALTTDDREEIEALLVLLEESDADTCLIHESYLKDDSSQYTRAWFAWANALYSELILRYVSPQPKPFLPSP